MFLQARFKKGFTPILNNLIPFFVVFLFSLGWSSFGFSAEVTLAWDPNTEPDLAGYKIYIGVQSRQYSWIQDVGTRAQATLGNLDGNITYFLSITAYNTRGMESSFSSELNYAPPTLKYKNYLPIILN